MPPDSAGNGQAVRYPPVGGLTREEESYLSPPGALSKIEKENEMIVISDKKTFSPDPEMIIFDKGWKHRN